MKKFSHLIFACGLIVGLVACNKEASPEEIEKSNERVYFQFKLELPSTRAAVNPNEPTEEGIAEENTIGGVKLVLVNPANMSIIAESDFKPNSGLAPVAGTQDLYTVSFKSTSLNTFAKDTQQDMLVMAYCNTVPKSNATMVSDVYQVVDGSADELIWKAGSFWMTNANDVDFKCKFPTKTELAKHTIPEDPFKIGTIAVERMAARFDFDKNHTVFPILDISNPDIELMKIELTDLALFNMNKQSYYLRRVSANGKTGLGDSWEGLFGKETGLNYVEDPVQDVNTPNPTNFLYVEGKDLAWTPLTDITRTDTWNDKSTEADQYDYRFWRYATENVIPDGTDVHKNLVTGVVFKGKLVPGKDTEATLKKQIEDHVETIYMYNQVIYGNWERLQRAAEADYVNGTDGDKFAENVQLRNDFNNALSILAKDTSSDDLALKQQRAATKAGFTAYPVRNGVYEVYYNYYNKHSDDNNDKTVGPMEYAVVRNNVYKLSVDKILKYGTPDYVSGDNSPVVTDDIFFEVSVRILPWTVRVNKITL